MNIFIKRLEGFYKYRFLMQQLVIKDIKLKYRRSILGYLWSILKSVNDHGDHGNCFFQYVSFGY